MRVGTIKILLAVLCLAGTIAMSGQTSDLHAVQKVTEPQTDTLTAAPHLLKQIKAAPVPGINGPQDVSLSKDESLKFLERFCSSPALWKRSNDPLRESLRNLVWLASKPPADTVISYLSQYPFDRIRVPAESYYLFDSVRIILPVLPHDSLRTDTAAVNGHADEMFISTGRRLEKVRLSADARPIMKNDTLKLNDSVYILMKDFIPARLPHQTNDTIVLVITDTLPEVSLAPTSVTARIAFPPARRSRP